MAIRGHFSFVNAILLFVSAALSALPTSLPPQALLSPTTSCVAPVPDTVHWVETTQSTPEIDTYMSQVIALNPRCNTSAQGRGIRIVNPTNEPIALPSGPMPSGVTQGQSPS